MIMNMNYYINVSINFDFNTTSNPIFSSKGCGKVKNKPSVKSIVMKPGERGKLKFPKTPGKTKLLVLS